MALNQRVSAVGEDVLNLLGEPLAAPQPGQGDHLLPEVEYMVWPEVPPKQTLRLEGHIRSIRRGREDFALSDEELAAIVPEEGNG